MKNSDVTSILKVQEVKKKQHEDLKGKTNKKYDVSVYLYLTW